MKSLWWNNIWFPSGREIPLGGDLFESSSSSPILIRRSRRALIGLAGLMHRPAAAEGGLKSLFLFRPVFLLAEWQSQSTLNGTRVPATLNEPTRRLKYPLTGGQEIKILSRNCVENWQRVCDCVSSSSLLFYYLYSRVENGNPARTRDARRFGEANGRGAACTR